MKDGNIAVRYNHDVATIALKELIDDHWAEIQKRHLDALATDEVLITGSGPNVFDDQGRRRSLAAATCSWMPLPPR